MFEGPPSTPSITAISTATDGSDKATIEWTYPEDGTSVDYFEVYRGVNGNLNRQGSKLSPDVRSFQDEGLSNCFTYEYMVVAGKECFDDANSMRVEKTISFNTDLNGFDTFSATKYHYNDRVSLRWEISEGNQASEIVIYRKRDGSQDSPEIIDRRDIESSSYIDYDTEAGVLYQYGLLAISCDGYIPSRDEVNNMTTDVGVRSETGIINGKITYTGGNAVEGVRVLATPSDGENRGVSLDMTGNKLTIPLEEDGVNWFPDEWTLSFWFRLHDKSAGQSILSIANGSDYLTISPKTGGQTPFYEIEYKEVSEIIGVEDELVGYEQANGEVLSLIDQTILGRVDGNHFTEYQKTEISGLASGDTLYSFQNQEPWLLNQADEWFELSEQSTSVAVPDSLIGYLQGDTIYEALDSDFIIAFIDNNQLRLAKHFNVSYQLGTTYAHIKDNEMIFADDSTTRGQIIDDIVYSAAGDPIHMIIGSNVFYVYRDELNQRLVRGKRFARKVPNDTDPDVSFDVFALEKTITEEVRKGELLGIVSTDRTKVFESEGQGLTNYLIDNQGIVRTAVYENKEIFVPSSTPSYTTNGHSLVSVSSGLEAYLFNATEEILYAINLREGVIDATNFVQDAVNQEYMFYLGDAVGGERQVFKAVAEQVNYVVGDTTETYYREAYQAKLATNTGSEQSALSPELYLGEYNNVLLTYDGNNLIYFINGVSVDTITVAGLNGLFKSAGQVLEFGTYAGIQDETLLWSKAKDSLEVRQDFNRYLSGGEAHLVGYWRLDEKVATNAFDASYTTDITGKRIFNEHHGHIHSEQWSNIVPEQEDLSFTSFTDEDGNYSIQSIIYTGSGNNFKIVPVLGTHSFEPSNKIIFIGPSQKIQNDQNFTDKSSFRVTGTVKFDPRMLIDTDDVDDPNAPNCYVEGVELYIDDKPVLEDGGVYTTNEDGRFEIDVPIGKHQIKVVKSKHTFAIETWPPTGTFDFQDGVNDLVFYDNTTRKVIGKVVGGTTEGSKVSGSGESANNIGVAEITLRSIGKTCYETVITTDSTTGEYFADLPPFRYNIVDINIPSKSASENRELRRLAEASIDLSNDNLSQDTVQCTGPSCTDPEVFYHLVRDFVYRTPSTFTVKQYKENGNDLAEVPGFLGAQNHDVGTGTSVDFTKASLPYEVFTPGEYIWGITLSEKYSNNDQQALDPTHAVIHYYDTIRSGEILISNGIAGEDLRLPLADGEVIYKFLTSQPSLLLDRQDPDKSFTKTVQIIGDNTSWRDPDNLFRGIVLGTTQDKSQRSFYTVASDKYELVNMILRDPPGSQSHTEFLENMKFTKIRNSTVRKGLEQSSSIKVGMHFEQDIVSIGVAISAWKFKHTFGFANETSQYREASESSAITFSEGLKLATSKENKNTGAGGDIFVGNALNIYYSPSYNLDIVPIDSCGGANECYDGSFDVEGKAYSFSRSRSISLGLEESTTFYYTQRQIEQLVVGLENDLLSITDPTEQNTLENQIRIWKSALAQNEYEKLMAKQAVQSKDENYTIENISFGYGTDINKSYSLGYSNDFNYSQQFSYYTGFDMHLETFVLFGLYTEIDLSIGQAVYADNLVGASQTNDQVTSIHFQDNDPGDLYSVDMVLSARQESVEGGVSEMERIYDDFNRVTALPTSVDIGHADADHKYTPGNTDFINPIFITKGGRTACPYEPEEKARYLEYLDGTLLQSLVDERIITGFSPHATEENRFVIEENPSQDYILNYGTFQRDQPGLRIEPRVLRGVPWDERAQFDIILENKNAEDTIRSYTLVVDQRTTGAGPTMRLDGERFIKGTPIPLYGGEQLNKTITVRPIRDVYEYEDIVVYLVAGCQFDFGQDLDFQEDIFARDTISVYFDPVCPRATSIAPTDGWIVNNQTGPTLQAEIQEQEYYFENHDKIKLQFKATYQSDEDWVDIAVWSRDEEEVATQVALGENYFEFPTDNNYIVYDWNTDEYNLPDGNYHIRWEYHCINGLESFSNPINGIIDRTSPHAFGRPSPADGVLSPGDEIVLTLNEPIEAGLVDRDFIKVSGKIKWPLGNEGYASRSVA